MFDIKLIRNLGAALILTVSAPLAIAEDSMSLSQLDAALEASKQNPNECGITVGKPCYSDEQKQAMQDEKPASIRGWLKSAFTGAVKSGKEYYGDHKEEIDAKAKPYVDKAKDLAIKHKDKLWQHKDTIIEGAKTLSEKGQ